jgi:Zn-dependent peptidase ImmA (M78 family)
VVPEYPVWEIERKAGELLQQAYPEGMPETSIDIEWLIEAVMGLQIVPIPGLKRGWNVPGVLCRLTRGQFCIVVDNEVMDHKPNYYRFTLGEELGHYVLHAECLPRVRSHDQAIKAYRKLNEWAVLHRNARKFAAAILVPMRTLAPNAQRVYADLVKRVGFGDPEAVRKYLAVGLAKLYEVSSESMGYRLKEYPERLSARVDRALQERLPSLP